TCAPHTFPTRRPSDLPTRTTPARTSRTPTPRTSRTTTRPSGSPPTTSPTVCSPTWPRSWTTPAQPTASPAHGPPQQRAARSSHRYWKSTPTPTCAPRSQSAPSRPTWPPDPPGGTRARSTETPFDLHGGVLARRGPARPRRMARPGSRSTPALGRPTPLTHLRTDAEKPDEHPAPPRPGHSP